MPPTELYNTMYRIGRFPWDIGRRKELVDLVESGRLTPCRVIDLGRGAGANAMFLAQHGFDVTGIDFSRVALAKATARAEAAGVTVRFVEGNLTALPPDLGRFDLLDDLSRADRDRYLQNVLPLATANARFLLWCFEWRPRPLDRLLGFMPMAPGEVERRFAARFAIERITGATSQRWRLIRGFAAYLMTANPEAAT